MLRAQKFFFALIFLFTITGMDAICGWNAINSSTSNSLNAVSFIPNSNMVGFAAGATGTLLKTVDAGLVWTAINTGRFNDFYAVDFVNSTTGVVVGATGTLLRTTNAGSSWYIPGSNTASTLYGLHFATNLIGFAVGDNATIIKTTDAGATWSIPYSNLSTTNTLYSVFFVNATEGFAVGQGGLILKTMDGGSNWSVVPSGVLATLKSVNFIDSNIGFAVGTGGTIIKTTTGGDTWAQITAGILTDLNCVFFTNNTTKGYISGSSGVILATTNIGIHWNQQTSSTINGFNSVCFADENTGFSAGANGSMDKTYNGGYGTLNLLNPIGGETWQVGSSQLIRWTSADITRLKIDFSTNSGLLWIAIDVVSASSGTYSWVVPNYPSAQCKIRVSDSSNSYVFDRSANNFSIDTIPVQSITILSPNGSESWDVNSIHNITWLSANVNRVHIILTKIESSTTTIDTLITNTYASAGYYTWTLPGLPASKCKIKIVSANDSTKFDQSDTFFAINDPSISLTLTSPNGGEVWNVGENRNIEWTVTGIDVIKLEYSTDNGSNWSLINDSIPTASGSYQWTIPNLASNQCKIRISHRDIPEYFDLSESVFTVNGVKLLYPVSNMRLLVGQSYNINWKSVNVQNLKIQYSTDNGINWMTLNSSYPANIGFFQWTIPNTPSSVCKVRLMDTQNSSLTDVLSGNITISGILQTSPLGGESWLVGTTQAITWLSANITRVKIEFSTNNGNNWTTIISNTSALTGSYTWVVPKNPSKLCKVKVTDLDNSSVYSLNDSNFTIAGEGVLVVAPNGGESWSVGSSQNIRWVSVNVNKVNIEYSTNNGKSWNAVALNITASLGTYAWTTPSSPSVESLIRITDADNSIVKDQSNTVFKLSGALYNVPTNWEFTTNTGASSVIIVPYTIRPLVGTRNISTGDAIALFFSRNDSLICAGYALWVDSLNMAITVWGDNNRTIIKDGYESAEKYKYKIWDALEGREIFATAKYSSGTDNFSADNVSILSKLYSYQDLVMPLQKDSWKMISSNLIPPVSDIKTIMSGVADNLDIMKNDKGYNYIPTQNVNQITAWDVRDGYQVYMNKADTLNISGPLAVPSDYSMIYEASKWYIISYLSESSMSITQALTTINSNILLVKDSDGRIYFPGYGIDQINNLNPGQGYKLCLSSKDTLVYPYTSSMFQSNENHPTPLSIVRLEKISNYIPSYTATGNNAVFVLESNSIPESAEIGIFNSNGSIYGSGFFENGRAVITVWGDNRSTNYIKEGADDGEELFLRYLSPITKAEYSVKANNITSILGGVNRLEYYTDAVLLVQADIGEPLGVDYAETQDEHVSIEPNPAIDHTTIILRNLDTYIKIRLFDAYGKELSALFNGNTDNKYFRLNLNCSDYSSGIYYVKLENGVQSITRKIVIIK